MKLLERWKILVGQSVALAPMLISQFADASQSALVADDWLPHTPSTPPVFKNTLNASDALNVYAAHRSHSSHSSHSSHYSSSGGYSAPSYSSPAPSYYSSPVPTTNQYRSTTPSTTSGTTPGKSTSRGTAPSSTSSTQPTSADVSMLVRRVQLALMIKTYYSGPIDGVLGNSTRGSIMAFQADSGIVNSGKMDTPTLNALGIAIP
ncbi:His-Xaa-Ser repeat protein HxsA [Pseudomonas syringae group genomosp. 3]|uniref:His-Xaa-Ser repeat protein HxsA n=1 Tax=Pseudomonas syringae group genomosp. 3 TaxID=251701 RepID=UPI000EFD5E21|nr:His-Xaa-Ser repeat protein HxsA [Pseudomonas syringae group genomosp. 3]